MPPNIAFYSDALTTGRRFGLGRYAWELFDALHKLPERPNIRPVSAHCTMSRANRAALEREYSYLKLPGGRRLISGLWTTFAAPWLENWMPGVDVVHSVELDYRIATRKPWVVTIHDLGPLTHPQFFRQSHPWLLKAALKSAINKAAAIICVSHATAEAVESYTKSNLGDRLVVVPEGVAEEFFASRMGNKLGPADESDGNAKRPPVRHASTPSRADRLFPPAPYFLWAGSVNPRKNLPRLLDAFEKISSEIPHHLLLTGGLGWDSCETMRRIKTCSCHERVHLLGHVSDAELRELYSVATAFVYVSLMEGFGLPILEAMAAGCPVVSSNLSSMPEVAGDAAFLVNPFDVEEIAQAMHCLATDSNFSRQLSIKGRNRAEEFHWDGCALAVAEIYDRVAGGAGKMKSRPNQRNGSDAIASIDAKELCVTECNRE
jgi:glycosyltransferase involved in cell wall biosynthesis